MTSPSTPPSPLRVVLPGEQPAHPAGAEPAADHFSVSRRGLITAIGNSIEFARLSQRIVGVLMIQLVRPDKLEAVVGVPTGELMKHAMRRLPGSLRSVDRAVAVTEEKIVVILPNLKSAAQAWLAAGKIQRTLEDGFSVDGEQIMVRPVVGIATYPEHAEIAEELIVHGDIAVGIANLRDVALHVFQKEDRRDSDIYLGLEAALREAIRLNRLELNYQPQIDLQSGKAICAEALLRWNAPGFGPVPPATIIRIAEANGIIGSLTAWVVSAAMRQQSALLKSGIAINLSINLSTVNLTDEELPEIVQQALGLWDVDPATITFEVTESAAVVDFENMKAVLVRLKQLGVKLAIDDFGTGYSSLSYLKHFPLDELKIDKIFIDHLKNSVADQRIVKSVIALAHDFGLKVVAEGVEDEATVRCLKGLGCDLAQGFVYSQALPLEAFCAWYAKHS